VLTLKDAKELILRNIDCVKEDTIELAIEEDIPSTVAVIFAWPLSTRRAKSFTPPNMSCGLRG
jgi:hypothetical protein